MTHKCYICFEDCDTKSPCSEKCTLYMCKEHIPFLQKSHCTVCLHPVRKDPELHLWDTIVFVVFYAFIFTMVWKSTTPHK